MRTHWRRAFALVGSRDAGLPGFPCDEGHPICPGPFRLTKAEHGDGDSKASRTMNRDVGGEDIPFSDSWVLLATVYAGCDAPADLWWVVAEADFINHAILTYEEVSGSLARLVRLGMIHADGDRFAPAAEVLGTLPRGRSAVHTDLRRIEKLLRSRSAVPERDPFSLSRTAYDAAVSRYTQEADRVTRVRKPRRA